MARNKVASVNWLFCFFFQKRGWCGPFSPTTKLGSISASFSLLLGSSKQCGNLFRISLPVV
jgi:hypothetical protein